MPRVLRLVLLLVLLATGQSVPVYADPPDQLLATAAAQATVAPDAGPGRYLPLAKPARMVDTGAAIGVPTSTLVAAQATVTSTFTGRNGVPATGVRALAMNLTVISPTATGYLPAWATGEAQPAVSNLLYTAGVAYGSSASIVRLNANGQASFKNASTGTLRLMVDVTGYFTDDTAGTGGSRFVPLKQTRIVDTRSKLGVPTNTPIGSAGFTFTAANAGGLPTADRITGAVLNVTALAPTANGHWLLYPTGSTAPGVLAGSFTATRSKTNSTIVKLAADGRLTLTPSGTGTAHYLVDVVGYFTSATASTPATVRVIPVAPKRIFGGAPVAAGASQVVKVTGVGGVPATGVGMVAVHTITSGAATSGDLVNYPTGQAKPAPATDLVNPVSGHYSFNLVWTRVSASGEITITNGTNVAVTLYVDVQAYSPLPGQPAPPTAVQGQAGDRSIALTWTPPADSGDLPVSGYVVTTQPGGAQVSTSTPSATVQGLDNGRPYTFTVVAKTAAGTSAASQPSAPVTPSAPAPPGRPLITQVASLDSAIRVDWSPPPETASGISGYTLTVQPGDRVVPAGPDATTATITGLTNGTTYRVTMTATNGNGTGAPSPASPPVTPGPAEKPMAPLLDVVTPLANRIDVQWVPPADGGAPITSYLVTLEPGGQAQTIPADTTVARFDGLTNGQPYKVTVVASNKAGTGEPATREGIVPTAARAPGEPLNLAVSSPVNGTLRADWFPPTDSGTSAITGYTVTAAPGGATTSVGPAGRTATLTGLDPAVSYTISVTANNTAGAGPASTSAETLAGTVVGVTPTILSAESLATLAESRADGVLIFENPPAQVTALKVGDAVTALPNPKFPQGIMRKVTARTVQGTALFLSTTQMPLNQLIQSGAVSAEQILTDDSTSELQSAPGTRRTRATIKGKTRRQGAAKAEQKVQGIELGLRDGTYSFTFVQEVGAENGFRAEVEGSVSVKPTDISKLSFGGGKVKTDFTESVDIGADIRWRAGLVSQLFTREWEVKRLRGPSITVMAGPVPVVLTTELKVVLKLDVEGNVGVQLRFSYGHEFGVKIHSEGSTVTAEKIDRSHDVNAGDVQLYAATTARLAAPQVGLYVFLYDLVGPGMTGGPFVELEVDTTLDPWWALDLGVQVGAYFGASTDVSKILGENLAWENDSLIEARATIKHAAGPFAGLQVKPEIAKIDANAPVTFDAKIVVAGIPTRADTVKWSVVQGPGTITADGTYSSPVEGAAKIKAHIDEGPATEEMNVEVGAVIGVGAPTAPTIRSVDPGPGSAVLAWRPPASDGGSALTYYAITTTPATGTTWVTSDQLSTRVPGLQPGKPYQFQISAENEKGMSPPSALSKAVKPVSIGITLTSSPQDVRTTEWGSPEAAAQPSNVAISGNGRYVFFMAQGWSLLMPVDARNGRQVHYLLRRDLWTGEIDLVSRQADGRTPAEVEFGAVGFPGFTEKNFAVSQSGEIVAYQEWGNGNRTGPIVVRDLSTGEIRGRYPMPSADELVARVKLSEDGTVLAYSADVRKGVGQWGANVYRATVGQGATKISTCLFSQCLNDDERSSLDMDGSGSTIVYETCGWPADGSSPAACHVRKWAGGATTDLLSKPTNLEDVSAPIISADGAWIGAVYRNTAGDKQGVAVMPSSSARFTAAHVKTFVPATSAVTPWKFDRTASTVAYSQLGANSTYPQRGYLMNRTSGALTPISTTTNNDLAADLSADGNILIYTQFTGNASAATLESPLWAKRLN